MEKDVQHERDLGLEGTTKDVSDRLKRWADACEFVCIRDTKEGWSYERGSTLAATYSFDIRKILTEVQVSILTVDPTQRQLQMASPFSLDDRDTWR